jgi:hypothetical protein
MNSAWSRTMTPTRPQFLLSVSACSSYPVTDVLLLPHAARVRGASLLYLATDAPGSLAVPGGFGSSGRSPADVQFPWNVVVEIPLRRVAASFAIGVIIGTTVIGSHAP